MNYIQQFASSWSFNIPKPLELPAIFGIGYLGSAAAHYTFQKIGRSVGQILGGVGALTAQAVSGHMDRRIFDWATAKGQAIGAVAVDLLHLTALKSSITRLLTFTSDTNVLLLQNIATMFLYGVMIGDDLGTLTGSQSLRTFGSIIGAVGGAVLPILMQIGISNDLITGIPAADETIAIHGGKILLIAVANLFARLRASSILWIEQYKQEIPIYFTRIQGIIDHGAPENQRELIQALSSLVIIYLKAILLNQGRADTEHLMGRLGNARNVLENPTEDLEELSAALQELRAIFHELVPPATLSAGFTLYSINTQAPPADPQRITLYEETLNLSGS